MKHSLAPVVDLNSRVLILGTLPGDMSLRRQEYYANPKNQFWRILSGVYGETIGANYDDRLRFLHDKGLALWDVLRSAEREGSSDHAIRHEIPNDFTTFLTTHSTLRAVAFNGQKAAKLFQGLVLGKQHLSMLHPVQFFTLPSTSPTPGRDVLSLE